VRTHIILDFKEGLLQGKWRRKGVLNNFIAKDSLEFLRAISQLGLYEHVFCGK
jgi:hypothetical protein